MLKRTLLLLLVLVTAGCSANPPAASPEAALPGQPAGATATLAPTATETPLPSATPEPTLTPTPALPVGLGTPAPLVSQPIEAANAGQLRLLATYSGDPYGDTLVSRDGTKAVFSSPEGTEIFDLAAGELVASLDAGIAYDRWEVSKGWLSMSDDASVIGVVAPDAVKILAADGTLLYSLENRLDEPFTSLAAMDGVGVSSDGGFAAIQECAEGEYDGCPFQVIDTQTGETIYTWSGDRLEAHGSAPLFSPDGAYLATWFDGQLWLWSTTDWTRVANFETDEMAGWVFSPDGQQILVGWGALQVWDIAERTLLGEYVLDNGMAAKKPFISPNGEWFGYADYGGTTAVWKTGTDGPAEIGDLESIDGIDDMTSITLSDDGQFRMIPSLPGHDASLWAREQGVNAFQFVPAEAGLELEMVGRSNGRVCRVGLDSAASCSSADFTALTPSGQPVFAIDRDGIIEVRATPDDSGELLASLPWSGWSFYLKGFDPQSHLLFYTIAISSNYGNSFIYDTEASAVIQNFDGGWMSGVHYSPDGQSAVFAVSHYPRLDAVVFDLTQQTVAFQDSFQYGMSDSLIFSPDGQKIGLLVAFNSQPINTIQLIDVARPHARTSIPIDVPDDEGIRSLAFSPDGSLIAVGLRDGRVVIVQTSDGVPVNEFQAFNECVDRLTFSPDSTLIAGYSASGYIKFWGIWP